MRNDELSFEDKQELKLAQKRAWKEIVWFFGTMHGCVPKEGEDSEEACAAAKQIQEWFSSIPSFYAGALTLRYEKRDWPAPIRKCFGTMAGIAVRVECAQHPSDRPRSDAELEQESIRRLLEMISDPRRQLELHDMEYRAKWHVRAAHKAYVKVRGSGPLVLPKGVARSTRLPPEAA